MKINWLATMAWRDSRKNRGKLALFLSSIVLGIAALVAINSFGDNLGQEIQAQARELLGADLSLSHPEREINLAIDLPLRDSAMEVNMASMVLFPGRPGVRLVQLRALEGDYPFYGNLVTEPAQAAESFREGEQALVDRTLLLQFQAEVGDSVRVGAKTFRIAGILEKSPGQSGITSAVAPVVLIPLKHLEATGLIQKGSRVQYESFYLLEPGADPDKWVEDNRPRLRERSLRAETVESRKKEVSEAFDDLSRFLALVAFVALLLGCVGVASAVYIYMREKIPTVAVLRCLGATGRQAFLIFLIQIAAMGFLGSVIGVLIGVAVQQLLPAVMSDFLPISVNTSLSWPSILTGLATGVFMAVLFALAPLLQIRRASPLLTIRSSPLNLSPVRDPLIWGVYAAILLGIFLFLRIHLGGWLAAAVFTGALALSFGLLALTARLVMWAVRRFFPVSWGFVWRQSLANLYRPHNQTMVLIATIGLGTALMSTVFYVQHMLLQQVELSGAENQPNFLMFDIQDAQLAGVKTLVQEQDLKVMQTDPVVNMRATSIKGYTRAQVQADSTIDIPNWAFNREYRVTYRSELAPTEKIVAGEWMGQASKGKPVPISIEKDYAENMGVGIGDRLVFDVQGLPVETEVRSLREVKWNRISSNFLVVFPSGVLEQAPKFHILLTRVADPESSARFQQAVLREYPTISMLDIGQILKTVEEVLAKVSFIIRFMAGFSILTGLIVLMSAVSLSRFQRLQESVLLRTLGGSRRQILAITLFEYFLLGSLAALTGIVLAFAGSWALAYFSFETSFQPAVPQVVLTYVFITALTVLIGYFNSRSIIGRPPLEVLRAEG